MDKLTLFAPMPMSKLEEVMDPVKGEAARYLLQMTGLDEQQFTECFDLRYIIYDFSGKSSLGKPKFPVDRAKVVLKQQLESLRGKTVIVLGFDAARAFGATHFQYMTWYCIPDAKGRALIPRLLVLPYPSKSSSFYKRADNEAIITKFLLELVISLMKEKKEEQPHGPQPQS